MPVVCTIYYCSSCNNDNNYEGSTPEEEHFDENYPQPTYHSGGSPLCCCCEQPVDLTLMHVKGTKEILPNEEIWYFLTGFHPGTGDGESDTYDHFLSVENNGFECSFCGEKLSCMDPQCICGYCQLNNVDLGIFLHSVYNYNGHDGSSCNVCHQLVECGSEECFTLVRSEYADYQPGDKTWQTKAWSCEAICQCHAT